MTNLCLLAASAVFAILAPSPPPDSKQPVTLETIRAAHTARAAAIQSLFIDEDVVTTRPVTAETESRIRGRMQDRVVRARERVLADSGCDPRTPEEELVLAKRLHDEVNTQFPDEVVAILHVNNVTKTSDRSVYDFAAMRYSRIRRDLRDLKQLAIENSIPEAQLPNLTASQTVLGTPEYTLVVNDLAKSGVVSPGSALPLHDRRLLLGHAPARLLSGQQPTTLTIDAQGAIQVRGTFPDSDQAAFELTLENIPGYPMTHMVRYSRSGAVIHEVTLSDFRSTDAGVLIAYHTEMMRQFGDGRVQTELRDVTSVQVNEPLPQSAFKVPPATAILPADAQAMEAFNADREKAR